MTPTIRETIRLVQLCFAGPAPRAASATPPAAPRRRARSCRGPPCATPRRPAASGAPGAARRAASRRPRRSPAPPVAAGAGTPRRRAAACGAAPCGRSRRPHRARDGSCAARPAQQTPLVAGPGQDRQQGPAAVVTRAFAGVLELGEERGVGEGGRPQAPVDDGGGAGEGHVSGDGERCVRGSCGEEVLSDDADLGCVREARAQCGDESWVDLACCSESAQERAR